MQTAARYWRTLWHLRPAQLWHRVRLAVRRHAWSWASARIDARYRESARGQRVDWADPGLAALARLRAERHEAGSALDVADAALAGRFTFLGEARDLGVPVPWDRPDLMDVLLWKTHLHEFPYALDLALAYRETRDARYRDGFIALAHAWAEAESIGKPGFARAAWNERAVATRLLHWLAAGALFGLREGDGDADWLGEEIVRHVIFLRDNLALDLEANHLFRDCIGLVISHALTGACPDGLALLEREVREQILPDGAHYERSAMYHAVCLADLIDAAAVLGEQTPEWLTKAVRRAAGFLASVLLGDGDIPLLGDAWRGEVEPGVLIEQARTVAGALVPPREPERWSGLVRLERGPIRAVLRAGPHGPDHQLGHAHADLLSFDLSHGTQRVITDTGTGQYAAGPARDWLRSTAAHNTVQIDGEELLETWSSFRSGRRGRAHCHGRGAAAGFAWIHASHDGWQWLRGAPVHHRLLVVRDEAVLILDAVLGDGVHRLASFLHVHPDAPADSWRVHPLTGTIARGTGPFHGRFGETREAPILTIEQHAELPWLGGFWLRFGSTAPSSTKVSLDGDIVSAEILEGDAQLRIRWTLVSAAVEIDVLDGSV